MTISIFTHINLDLDAVCSVWAARTFIPAAKNADIEFRPANWDGEDLEPGDLALDIEAGGRGLKGEVDADGHVHSCFRSIVRSHADTEDQAALRYLVDFVDAQDAHGSAVKFLAPEASPDSQRVLSATGLNAVLRALQGLHKKDWIVLERLSEILSGILIAGRARLRAEEEADGAEILPGGKVAICVENKEFPTNGILFERGVRVIVYVDGYNLGLIRHGEETLRMDHPDLREVVGGEREWFSHPAGFLFCRGSRKAPARSPSAVSPRALAEAAAKLLESS
jgi:hypothetical protein